jgi:uncharacterized protein YqcC (DUF446 family)
LIHTEVAELLIDIESELRQLNLWEATRPPDEALASEQPFAVDTLSFPQWLQFIFLPRMHLLVETRSALPTACGIAPMAEEAFRARKLPIASLLDALEAMDRLLSGGDVDYAARRS